MSDWGAGDDEELASEVTVYLRRCADGAWLGTTTDGEFEHHEAFRTLPNAKRWGAEQLERKRVRWSASGSGNVLTASRVLPPSSAIQ